jgi:hypothetical protein
LESVEILQGRRLLFEGVWKTRVEDSNEHNDNYCLPMMACGVSENSITILLFQKCLSRGDEGCPTKYMGNLLGNNFHLIEMQAILRCKE